MVIDTFGIGACRSKSAKIDGGNGFPVHLFVHAVAANAITRVPFNV